MLKQVPGAPPVDRRRRREAERAATAAAAAAPEVCEVALFEDAAALLGAALPHAAALRLGQPGPPARPRSSDDFTVEVAAAGGARSVSRLRGYRRSGAAPLAGPGGNGDSALVTHWVEGGTLERRLASKRRVAERDLHRRASGREQGDSTSLQRECSARARSKKKASARRGRSER